MPIRQLVDAGAQSTVTAPITAVQTSVTLQSASGFPGILSGGQVSVTILDSGNPAYNAAAPLATPFEYQPVNAIAGNVLTFGPGGGAASRAAYAGTTPRSYFGGATVAAGLLAEDILASAPWKFDEQIPGAVTSITIPASGSIPASYLGINWRTIRIRVKVRTTSGNATDFLQIRFNGDAGANYDQTHAPYTTGAMTADSQANQTQARCAIVAGGIATAGRISTGWIEIFGYSDVTAHAFHAQGYQSANVAGDIYSGEWHGTAAAITSISLSLSAGNFSTSPACLITTELSP